MSTRVMDDGKPYTRTTCRTARKRHRPVPRDREGFSPICEECHRAIYWAPRPRFPSGFWRHYPGTFWTSDR